MIIVGLYLDNENVQQKEFLGYSYNDAFTRMKYVKDCVEFTGRVTGTDYPEKYKSMLSRYRHVNTSWT